MGPRIMKSEVFEVAGDYATLKKENTQTNILRDAQPPQIPDALDVGKNKGHCSMPVLPPEILAMIFRYLVPERSAATADKPPYDKLSSSALYRGLINVSRAGKHFHNLAKPLLLEKVVLSNCPNMYKFFRTLVQDPEKGKHIKHLSLDFPVNDNFNVYSIPPNLLQEAAVIVTMIFNDPYLPYDIPSTFAREKLPWYWKWYRDKRVEIDVVPQADNWAHANMMVEVAELAEVNFQTPPRELLEKPELIPLLSTNEYLAFLTCFDRLKNIRYLKDMGLEKHIDSLKRLQLLSKKEGLSGLDHTKHDVFLKAYKLIASNPRQDRLRTPTMNFHLQLFEFIDFHRDQRLYFENQVDATTVTGLTLTRTRDQCDVAEYLFHRGSRAWQWHCLDNRLAFFPNLEVLHLPLFLSHKLSKMVYPWGARFLLDLNGDVQEQGHLGWANLRNLTKLKELTITFSGLTGEKEALASLDSLVDFFASYLPPSVETLNLVEWWSGYYAGGYMRLEWRESDWARWLEAMLGFLDKLSSAIARVRPPSLKRIEVSCIEGEGPAEAFYNLEQRLIGVVNMLGISLVIKPLGCARIPRVTLPRRGLRIGD
ncbi:hypothetical protein B0H65DRAFT_576093 [Neurospora tetraspora]|uniref:Uncharacterized protein n=1 Tax=Neurospora tetraspora TaxID=94610 RepID=A0AAE0JCU3_9PEZI|nr:hypothetical protein B0H65DRAFT_576093 [Neurospora tetraspora]